MFYQGLTEVDLEFVTSMDDIDVACDNFTITDNCITDKHAPTVSHRVSNKSRSRTTDKLRKAFSDFLHPLSDGKLVALDCLGYRSKCYTREHGSWRSQVPSTRSRTIKRPFPRPAYKPFAERVKRRAMLSRSCL